MPRFSRFHLAFFLLNLFSFAIHADTALTKRKDVQRFIQTMVREHHFSQQELIRTLNQVQLQPKIIESMERPYEKKNWDVYRDIFLTPTRLKGGVAFWQANRKMLEKAQQIYGVPPEMIVAILGVETLYGERQGDNRVLDALATLAFDYPKRSAYFTHELKEYLLLCKEHKVSPTSYKGSYAGAIGKPQFMPSSYRNYAVDYQHKGIRDLVSNNEDSIASIANYFRAHGWQNNANVAQPAHLVGKGYKQVQVNPKTANYTYQELLSHGIKPLNSTANPPARAGLIELTTASGNEYWLAYPNFFVITRYNSSPQYALAVYLLSQQLKREWLALNAHQYKAYA